jgi:hypothetical protein
MCVSKHLAVALAIAVNGRSNVADARQVSWRANDGAESAEMTLGRGKGPRTRTVRSTRAGRRQTHRW